MRIRTVQFMADISGPLSGKLKDWPSHIQDRLLAKVAEFSKMEGETFDVVDSYCDYDYDKPCWYTVLVLQTPAERPEPVEWR